MIHSLFFLVFLLCLMTPDDAVGDYACSTHQAEAPFVCVRLCVCVFIQCPVVVLL